jgi:AbrB family looped-hinge helix DNA binding protein
MATVRVSSKFQITIPKGLREKLGVRAGQQLCMTELDDGILLTPVPEDPIEFLSGIFADGPSLTESLLRDRALEMEHERRLDREEADGTDFSSR